MRNSPSITANKEQVAALLGANENIYSVYLCSYLRIQLFITCLSIRAVYHCDPISYNQTNSTRRMISEAAFAHTIHTPYPSFLYPTNRNMGCRYKQHKYCGV